jgi:hypothetical protein
MEIAKLTSVPSQIRILAISRSVDLLLSRSRIESTRR